MTQEFRSCKCGAKLDSPIRKTRGRPETLCKACKVSNKNERQRKVDATKAAAASALHHQMTRRFHQRFPNKGSLACQSFMAKLFDEICENATTVPVVFRRAITKYVEPEGKNATLFAVYFGPFCRKKRGLEPFLIFKKNVTEDQRRQWRALERAARKDDELEREGAYIYPEYSCIEWLMRGFDEGDTSLIEDGSDAFYFPIEDEPGVVPLISKTKTVKEVVYDFIATEEKEGKTHVATIVPLLVLRGFDGAEVVSSINELIDDGAIWNDQNILRVIKEVISLAA